MTNKEAIEILLDMANELQLIPESKQGQAFKMALKLLDNENVFDKINAEINDLMHNKDNTGYVCGILDCLDIIDKYTGNEE